MLEPFSGLTVKNVTLDDTGAYECIGTMNNVTTRKFFKLIVSGIKVLINHLSRNFVFFCVDDQN